MRDAEILPAVAEFHTIRERLVVLVVLALLPWATAAGVFFFAS